MQTKVGLLSQCTWPDSGFPLDELVTEVKNLFEQDGLPGVVRVLLWFVDEGLTRSVQSNPEEFFKKHELKPCCNDATKFYRVKQDVRHLKSVVGRLKIHLNRIRCCGCSKTHVPLRNFLKLDRYQSKTREFKKKCLETVSEQSYRKSVDDIGRYAGSELTKSTLHAWVMKTEGNRIKMTRKDLIALIADGSGYKRYELQDQKLEYGKKEIKVVMGMTKDRKTVPIGVFTSQSYAEIGRILKKLNSHPKLKTKPMAEVLVSDGEPAIDSGLSKLAIEHQRCTFHILYELKGVMRYQDQAKDNEIRVVKDELHRILNLPEQVLHSNSDELQNLSDADKKKILSLIFEAEARTNTVIQVLEDKGCMKTATYLKNSKGKMFGSIRQGLHSGSFAPRASSHIEKMMDHIGIRLKKIGRNFSPKGAEKLAAIILKRKCTAQEWDQDWNLKMGFTGQVKLELLEVKTC
jgi:hypothetical protein